MLPVTVSAPVAAVPDVDKFCDPNAGATLVPAIAAEALTSAFTIDPSTILADTTESDANLAAVTASSAMSPVAIVPSTISADSIVRLPDMFASTIVTSVGNAPAASFVVANESLPSLLAIAALVILLRSSLSKGRPPAVDPSCTTAVSYVVSIVTSPSAPANDEC